MTNKKYNYLFSKIKLHLTSSKIDHHFIIQFGRFLDKLEFF